MNNLKSVFLLITLAMFLSSCVQRREEDKISLILKDIERLVERKDSSGLLAYLAEDYLDFEDNDKQKTAEMIEEYFSRYRGIVVHLLASRINRSTSDRAEVQVEVALSSGAAEALRRLFSRYGECYRFYLDFQLHEKKWLIREAAWEYVPRANLFPESIELLDRMLGGD